MYEKLLVEDRSSQMFEKDFGFLSEMTSLSSSVGEESTFLKRRNTVPWRSLRLRVDVFYKKIEELKSSERDLSCTLH